MEEKNPPSILLRKYGGKEGQGRERELRRKKREDPPQKYLEGYLESENTHKLVYTNIYI